MLLVYLFFFFKQKTAYEMRISDWSSDVCSSDLSTFEQTGRVRHFQRHRHAVHTMHVECNTVGMEMDVQQPGHQKAAVEIDHFGTVATETGQIGRASCRERECQYV